MPHSLGMPIANPADTLSGKLEFLHNTLKSIGDDSKEGHFLAKLLKIVCEEIEEAERLKSQLLSEIGKMLGNIAGLVRVAKKLRTPLDVDKVVMSCLTEFEKGEKAFVALTHSLVSKNYTLCSIKEGIQVQSQQMLQTVEKDCIRIFQKMQHLYSLASLIGDGFSDKTLSHLVPSENEVQEALSGSDAVHHLCRMNIDEHLLTRMNQEEASLTRELEQRSRLAVSIGREMDHIYRELEDDPDPVVEKLLNSDAGLSSDEMALYSSRLESVCRERQERQGKVSTLKAKCERLYAIMKIDSKQTERFLSENASLTKASISNLEEEIYKLNKEKCKHVEAFINDSRIQIKAHWDQLLYSEKDRKESFPQYFDTDLASFTDEFLEIHMEEISRLSNELEPIKPLLSQISQFRSLLQDKKFLEDSSKDASRLLARDSFKILRQEERLRTRVSKLLPTTIQKLKKSLQEFEVSRGEPFFVSDQSMMETVLKEEDQLRCKRKVGGPYMGRQPIKRSISNVDTKPKVPRNANRSAPASTFRQRPIRKPLSAHVTPTRVTVRRNYLNTNESVKCLSSPVKRFQPRVQDKENVPEVLYSDDE